MSITLFISLVVLGLAAIDPIGIAIMPIVLLQKHPYTRSFAFLSGSFTSLMVMGLLFSQGLGSRVLHFENRHSWIVPTIELAAGIVLIAIAATVFWRQRKQPLATEPSAKLKRQLELGNPHLFLIGAALVAIQSIIDVVFVIAMIRIGQLHLSTVALIAAVMTYAIAALVLQLAVIVTFRLAPRDQRALILNKVHKLVERYANELLIVISAALGSILVILAALN